MTTPPPGGPLNNEELRTLSELLARFATHGLDQFSHWRVETPHGAAYINISNGGPDGPEEAYTTIWPLPDHLQETLTAGD